MDLCVLSSTVLVQWFSVWDGGGEGDMGWGSEKRNNSGHLGDMDNVWAHSGCPNLMAEVVTDTWWVKVRIIGTRQTHLVNSRELQNMTNKNQLFSTAWRSLQYSRKAAEYLQNKWRNIYVPLGTPTAIKQNFPRTQFLFFFWWLQGRKIR